MTVGSNFVLQFGIVVLMLQTNMLSQVSLSSVKIDMLVMKNENLPICLLTVVDWTFVFSRNFFFGASDSSLRRREIDIKAELLFIFLPVILDAAQLGSDRLVVI